MRPPFSFPTSNLGLDITVALSGSSQCFPGGSNDKESSCNAGDLGSIPGLGRSPGEENGYPLQYSCLEKTLMLGKIEGRRRRGWQRMRWLGGVTDSMNMSLSKLQEMVKDREAGYVTDHGVAKSWTQQQPYIY